MAMTNAAAMAASAEPPELKLPRLRWVPWLGPLLAEILPPKVHRGIVLSYSEFAPFRNEFEASWKKAAAGDLSEDEFKETVVRFIKAQRLPVRPILSLPGSVLTEVIEDLFLCQSRPNLPAQMVEIMEREFLRRRTGQASPGKARRTRRRSLSRPTTS